MRCPPVAHAVAMTLACALSAEAQTIGVNDPQVTEGHSGSVVRFTIKAAPAPAADITVSWATANGTASAGSDYLAASGVATIPAGTGNVDVPITVNGDTLAEGNETFLLNLAAPSAGTLGDAVGQATILDDEGVAYPPLPQSWTVAEQGMVYQRGLVWDLARLVSVGNSGDIWTSTDGVAWTKQANPDPGAANLFAVTKGTAGWLAVGANVPSGGANSGPVVLTSPDATTWTQRDLSTQIGARTLRAALWSGGTYVVAGASGRVATSPDGATWTQRTSGTTQQLNGLAAFGGVWLAVGNTRTVLRSVDAGATWAPAVSVPAGVASLNAVAFWAGQFVAVGTAGSIMTSPDGDTWTQRTAPTANNLVAVAPTGAGGFVAFALPLGGSGEGPITSPDGVTWTHTSFPTGVGSSRLAFAAVDTGPLGLFAVGFAGSVYRSTDQGSSWTNRTLAASRNWRRVAHDGTRFCAIGEIGAVASSTDGVTWTPRQPALAGGEPIDSQGIVHFGSSFVVVGGGQAVMTSPDCVTWTNVNPSPVPPVGAQWADFNDVTTDGALLVAVGNKYTALQTSPLPYVATSPDGTSWTERAPGIDPTTTASMYAVERGNGRFVAFPADYYTNTEVYLITSDDGATWTQRYHPTGNYDDLNDIAFGGGRFLGGGGRVLMSADGLAWWRPDVPGDPSTTFYIGSGFGEGRWVASGTQGRLVASADGSRWTAQQLATRHSLHGSLAYAPALHRFVVVGEGVIGYSTDAPPTLTIADTSLAEGNSGTSNASFTVTLSAASAQPVSVAYATADGTASAGSDYTASSGTLTFAAGTTSQIVTVAVLGDLLDEANETFTVNLSSAVGATISDSAGLGSITDDDGPPTLGIGDVTVTEGNTGTTNAVFTVALSVASGLEVSVPYMTVDGTAVAPGDYAQQAGTLTFPAGATTRTVTVAVNGDTSFESNETFSVFLSPASNATIGDATGVGTILNDDPAGRFPIATGAAREYSFAADFDGTNFMAAMQGGFGVGQRITTQLVSPSGALVGSRGDTGRTGDLPAVAFDGSRHLVVWNDDGTGANAELYGQFFTTAGAVSGSPFLIATGLFSGSHSCQHGGVAWGGGTYLTTYCRAAPSPTKLYGRLISASGTVGPEFPISSNFGQEGDTLAIAFDGTNFLAVWNEDSVEAEIWARFVSPAGVPGTEILVNASPQNSTLPFSVAFDGTRHLVLWGDLVGPGSADWDLFGQLLDTAGNKVGGVITVSAAAGQQWVPFAASDGGRWLVIWSDARNDADGDGVCDAGEGTCQDVYGRYLAPTGEALGPEFTIDASAGNQWGGLAYGAGRFLTLLTDYDTDGGLLGDVYGRFLGDPQPSVSISASQTLVERDGPGLVAGLTVSLSASSGQEVRVSYATTPGTASAAGDYTASSGTLTFTPGQTSQNVSVAITGDTLPEITESFTVVLSSPVNAGLGTAQATITIRDDERAASDWTGDGRSEAVVYRGGAWLPFDYTTGNALAGAFTGQPDPACIPALGDFDGDGRPDLSQLCGDKWFFYGPTGSLLKTITTGGTGSDRPVPADYDGDGRDDVVVYRLGAWLFFSYETGASTGGVFTGHPPHFTGGTPTPVPMDHDGDGKADFTIYSGGPWHFFNADGSYLKGIWTGSIANDIPVAGDYDGNGKDDVVVWRGGAWLAFDFATGTYDPAHSVFTGAPPHFTGGVSLPTPLDVNGDGKLDRAVYAGGPWHFYQASGAYDRGVWCGAVPGDLPLSRRLLP